MIDKINLSETCFVDTGTHQLINILNPAVTVDIPNQPWLFFSLLLENPHNIIPYSTFISVFEFDPSEKGVIRRISNIKSKLINCFKQVGLNDSETKKLIVQRGKGYRLCLPQMSLSIESTSSLFLSEVNISRAEASSLVDLMLNKGFSGKMGRHSLLHMAHEGNACAMFEIGEMYYYGFAIEGGEPRFSEAYNWYLKAAEKNHPAALWTLGYMEINSIFNPDGKGMPINYIRAYHYLTRAEKLGSPAALTSIGQLWEEGHVPSDDYTETGVFLEADIDKALEYYQQADKLGYHYATNRLARYYEINGDYDNALKLYLRSSSMITDGYTLNKLGQFYENGFGCERDIHLACQYYKLSTEGVLPNDVTPWGLFNAGRMYCGRIPGQTNEMYDGYKGLDYMFRAIDRLETLNHGKIITELYEILIRMVINKTEISSIRRYIVHTQTVANDFVSFLESISPNSDKPIVRQLKKLEEQLDSVLAME